MAYAIATQQGMSAERGIAEEFATIKEQNEREISHWQTRTSELEQAALGLALCVETTNRMATM